jgi:hypothetical protein
VFWGGGVPAWALAAGCWHAISSSCIVLPVVRWWHIIVLPVVRWWHIVLPVVRWWHRHLLPGLLLVANGLSCIVHKAAVGEAQAAYAASSSPHANMLCVISPAPHRIANSLCCCCCCCPTPQTRLGKLDKQRLKADAKRRKSARQEKRKGGGLLGGLLGGGGAGGGCRAGPTSVPQ